MPTRMPYCAEDELAVECWCQRTVVPVPAADVQRGVTRSCGDPRCNRMAEQHRRAS